MFVPVKAAYRHNGSRVAIACPAAGDGVEGYQFVALVDQDGTMMADLNSEAYPTIDELVALCSEVATENNQICEDEQLRAAKEALLPENLRVMSNWMVGVGRTITNDHEDHYEERCDAFEDDGAELYPGERRMLQLLVSGLMPMGLELGEKTLHFSQETKGFFATGKSKLWSAQDLCLLLMLVLSDEYAVEKFKEQGSPFLVVPFREHRVLLNEQQLAALDQFESGDVQIDETIHVANDLGVGGSDGDTDIEIPETPESGSVLAQVLEAGQQAIVSDDESETGFPEVEQAIAQFRQTHFSSSNKS